MRKNTVAAAALLACTVGAKAAAPTQTAAALVDLSLEQLSNVTVSTVSGRAGFDLTPAHRPRCLAAVPRHRAVARGAEPVRSPPCRMADHRRSVEIDRSARFWCSYA
jgi:hypothetical protein